MSRVKSQYCAYSHLSAMLSRTGLDWWVYVFEFEIYWDDSGTDASSPIAVAACYVATKAQWDEFVRNWDEVREKEDFDVFHMADFMARPENGVKPFCNWDKEKKDRVYFRLANIINTRVRMGFGLAIPKASFDQFAPVHVRKEYSKHHYTFAVKSVFDLVSQWHMRYAPGQPVQYIFDWMNKGTGKGEIQDIWELCQGRSKSRPQRRSNSRPEEQVGDRGLSGRRASGAEACAA